MYLHENDKADNSNTHADAKYVFSKSMEAITETWNLHPSYWGADG